MIFCEKVFLIEGQFNIFNLEISNPNFKLFRKFFESSLIHLLFTCKASQLPKIKSVFSEIFSREQE